MGKDIFISHAWGDDSNGRNNHTRSKEIADLLISKGYSVWFDSYDMCGNIDSSIMNGINNCGIFIILSGVNEAECFVNEVYIY